MIAIDAQQQRVREFVGVYLQNFILSGVYNRSSSTRSSQDQAASTDHGSRAHKHSSLVLFVKDAENDIEKINEHPIDIDEKHELFYLRRDPGNRFKSMLGLVEFYTAHDRLVAI